MRDVEGLALGASAIDVDQDHLGEQAALHERESRGGTDEAATDDGNLAIVHHVYSSFPPSHRWAIQSARFGQATGYSASFAELSLCLGVNSIIEQSFARLAQNTRFFDCGNSTLKPLGGQHERHADISLAMGGQNSLPGSR